MIITQDDIDECTVTKLQAKERLEYAEQVVAARMGITENIRETLVKMCRDHDFVHADDIDEWIWAFDSFNSFDEL